MPIILGGLIAGITGIISSIAIPSIDDGGMKSDGTFISSPKGTVRLNNADSAVFGTKLDTKTHLYLYREGNDPISHTYTYSKNLDINLFNIKNI